MRGKLWFLGGMAAGFVLGARAGREAYDGITRAARKVKDSPTMQEATGVIQEQATRLLTESKARASALMAQCQHRFGCPCQESTPRVSEPDDVTEPAGVAELGETTGPGDTTEVAEAVALDTTTGPAAVPDLDSTSEFGT